MDFYITYYQYFYTKASARKRMQNLKSVITYMRLDMLPLKKQPPRGVTRKRCPENMQQISRGTPTPKCDFSKVALHFVSLHCGTFLSEHFMKCSFRDVSWNIKTFMKYFTFVSKFHCVCFSSIKQIVFTEKRYLLKFNGIK